MKRIIEIEKREFDLIEETTFVEDTDVMFRQTAEDREKTLMMFRIIDAIKSSTPYNPSGDCISREALKKAIKDSGYSHYFEIFDIIDNAQAIEHSLLPLSGEADNAYMRGYEVGKAEGILKANARPKGEWARHDEWRGGEYIGGFYHVNCPCEDGYYSKWRTNFCPNCGLPMMKGDEEK